MKLFFTALVLFISLAGASAAEVCVANDSRASVIVNFVTENAYRQYYSSPGDKNCLDIPAQEIFSIEVRSYTGMSVCEIRGTSNVISGLTILGDDSFIFCERNFREF